MRRQGCIRIVLLVALSAATAGGGTISIGTVRWYPTRWAAPEFRCHGDTKIYIPAHPVAYREMLFGSHITVPARPQSVPRRVRPVVRERYSVRLRDGDVVQVNTGELFTCGNYDYRIYKSEFGVLMIRNLDTGNAMPVPENSYRKLTW